MLDDSSHKVPVTELLKPEDAPCSRWRNLTTKDTRVQIGEMLIREGLVTRESIDRVNRIQDKIGDEGTLFTVLAKLNQVTEEDFLDTVRKSQPDLPIGALLVELGMISKTQLRQALRLQEQENYQEKIGDLLIGRRMLKEREFVKVLASQLGFRFMEPDVGDCDTELLSSVVLNVCQKMEFLPIRYESDNTVVVFSDPMDQEARTEAARMVGTGIVPVMATNSSIQQALSSLQRSRERNSTSNDEADEFNAASILADEILQAALAVKASDIHIEPLHDRVRVRFRVDGILREDSEFSQDELPALVSRLKIMADADIVERRRHQDGRIAFEDPTTGAISDLRASFYVTVHGECVVLRVLNQSSKIMELDEIGMCHPMLQRFKHQGLDSPTGVLIVTGPTGSGKTNTLYSCVQHLNNETTSIITAEDPVEFQVDGISQCAINTKIGRTFDESLKHIVRQDPDVIVLGEIRDTSSAESAIQAALTGHKVLTTFHTEDSIGGLLRLMNMNIEAFLISSTVVCVVAQRLLRRICKNCSKPIDADPQELQLLGTSSSDMEGADFSIGDGCSECHFTGFKGRIAVFEILILSEAVKEAILQRKTSEQIRRISVESAGLVTLLEDGLVKAAAGQTTLGELRRTLPRLRKPRSLQELRRLTGLIK